MSEWQYGFITPYPGTELYAELRSRDVIQDDLAFVYRLCRQGDTRNLIINLTAFSDQELVHKRDEAVGRVRTALTSTSPAQPQEDLIRQAFSLLLGRTARPTDVAHFTKQFDEGLDPESFIFTVATGEERRRRMARSASLCHERDRLASFCESVLDKLEQDGTLP